MMGEEPHYQRQEDFVLRKTKLEEIKELGVEPYPHHFSVTSSVEQVLCIYKDQDLGGSEEAEKGNTPEYIVGGRLVLFRAMGKNAFAHLQESNHKLQFMCNRDNTRVTGLSGEMTPLKFIEKKLDLGDIIGLRGNLFRTQKGELTLYVKELTLLAKSLLPLPDKHSGLADKGVRYRKRWLDLITHAESSEVLRLRSRILHLMRQFMHEEGFLEVETPVLQNIYGGAAARPFKTHLHALHQEMFLRISLEIPLKKLLVGGLDKVFEISKVFRNEGIDRTHNPEFTEIEAYATYWDYNDMMSLMERMYETIALGLFGKSMVQVCLEDGKKVEINLKAPWKRISMVESVKHYADIDYHALSREGLVDVLSKRTQIEASVLKKASKGLLLSFAFEELVEKHLIQPHHIIDHPIETTPLCKLHRDPELAKEGFVERFETFILGNEYSNSYTELNDPIFQRKLLEEQQKELTAGNEEAHPLDEEFLESLCQGMPPAGGIGMGVDRMVMLFSSAHSIRDVIYFPLMKEKEG